MTFDDIQTLLTSYDPISLEETEAVKLMHRVDTKFLVRTENALQLLLDIRPDYRVLEIASLRVGAYESTYYDTDNRQMFHTHVTGRFPRYKVRDRLYSQNGLRFLEVKQKNNTGRTFKRRIPFAKNNNGIDSWLSEQMPYETKELAPVLINNFDRITLVNKEQTERVTLDFNLSFHTPNGFRTPVYDRVTVVELKQDKTARSRVRESLRGMGFRPGGMSKYCVGMLLLNSHLHYKRYKRNFSKFLNIQYE